MSFDFNYIKRWFDVYGFIHDKPVNIDGPETSENGALFTAIEFDLSYSHLNSSDWIIRGLNLKSAYSRLYCGNKVWRPTPVSASDGSAHLSPDNLLGIYAYWKLSPYWDERKKDLPWLTWRSRGKWNISAESIFLFYCKFPYLGWVFFPYFLAAMIFSFKSELNDVSGRQKWFLRASVFLPKPFLWYATKMAENQYRNSWYSVFNRYYKFQGLHPIVRAAEGYINGQKN